MRYWSYKCIAIICFPSYDVINFEINFIFLIKPFFYMTKNQDKNLISWEQKELLKWNKKHFLSFLTDFHLPKIVLDLTVRV